MLLSACLIKCSLRALCRSSSFPLQIPKESQGLLICGILDSPVTFWYNTVEGKTWIWESISFLIKYYYYPLAKLLLPFSFHIHKNWATSYLNSWFTPNSTKEITCSQWSSCFSTGTIKNNRTADSWGFLDEIVDMNS